MEYGLIMAVGTGSILCGVALMYLVMMRTMKRRIVEPSAAA